MQVSAQASAMIVVWLELKPDMARLMGTPSMTSMCQCPPTPRTFTCAAYRIGFGHTTTDLLRRTA